MISQLPLYALLLIFVIAFFTGAKDGSETMVSITDILLRITIFSFCISCIVSIAILLMVNRNERKAFNYSIAASVLLVAVLYYLYYYGAHILFIAVPLVIVLYHALMFSSFGRIFISSTSKP